MGESTWEVRGVENDVGEEAIEDAREEERRRRRRRNEEGKVENRQGPKIINRLADGVWSGPASRFVCA